MTKEKNGWGNRIIGASMILLVLVIFVQAASSYFTQPTAVLHLAGARFDMRIADTDKTRIKGLSGTLDLPADEALLFVFDYDNRWSIWMKDMNYAIDIVWLNSNRKVVDFVTNVPPDSYPSKTFFPKEQARYVIEFRSGTVKEKGIKVGQEAVFSGTSRGL